MDNVLNWGLLSTAKINRALIKPLRASKRTRLLGVASRSQSSAEAYASEWKIPRAYGSYEAMLADPEIDVVYNSLPNHLHAEWTVKALQAGKHVLCEKPLALTVAEVDRIIAASNETGKIATEAFMYRHHAQTLKIKEIVDSNLIGQVQLIKGAFTFTLTREGDYRLIKEYGGGSLWDVGCYPISFARMVVGEEPVDRGHPLHEPLLQAVPLVGVDDPRHDVGRDQALGAGAVFVLGAVDREGDTHAAEDHLGLFAARAHRRLGLARQPARIRRIVRPHTLPRHRLGLALPALGLRLAGPQGRQLLVHLVKFQHCRFS